MMQERTNNIMKTLEGIGTQENILYTNQEIIDNLMELQAAMARGVFEKTHADNLKDRDIMIHFSALAKEYGIDESERFLRFKKNMDEMGYTIGSFIKGINGEKIARRALKLLSFDKRIKIIYNLQLEKDDLQAEYDALVIAPYGLFVIEVKNWNSSMTISKSGILTKDDGSGVVYDLPGRMSVKEALLREFLADAFPDKYEGILLCSNEKVRITDYYKNIPISYGSGISYEIRRYDHSENYLDEEHIQKIEDVLLKNHKEQKTYCQVRCDEIIGDYASLMAEIEYMSQVHSDKKEVEKDESDDLQNHISKTDWHNVGKLVAGVALIIIPTITSTILLSRK